MDAMSGPAGDQDHDGMDSIAFEGHELDMGGEQGPGNEERKPVVVRSARACTVCRVAKMRCIGGEDGKQACQRCKRQNLECIFEKHRRGRKPGSKLSEHSKALRKAEREMKSKTLKDPHLSLTSPTQPGPSSSSSNQFSTANAAPASSSKIDLSPINSAPPGSAVANGTSHNTYTAPKPEPLYSPVYTTQAPHSRILPTQSNERSVPHYPQQPPQPHSQPHSQPQSQPQHQPPPQLVHHHSYQHQQPQQPQQQPPPPPQPLLPQPHQQQQQQQQQQNVQYTVAQPRQPHNPSTEPQSPASKTGVDLSDESVPDMDETIYPVAIIDREKKRVNTFMKTVLNPSENQQTPQLRATSISSQKLQGLPPYQNEVEDPLSAGLIDFQNAEHLLSMIFEHLNPFINLFDRRLHTIAYIQRRSPFLLSCLMMAGCKFWKPEFYVQTRITAYNYAYRALIEDVKSVECVQAFACLTYWKEPDDKQTWKYIGFACRLALEIGLNKTSPRSKKETEFEQLERLNRERTYLVLFVHDRALSMQTGRASMLPDDMFTRRADKWWKQSRTPNDIIISAFVELRRIASDASEYFLQSRSAEHLDIDYRHILNQNGLTINRWSEHWSDKLRSINAPAFYHWFMTFFRLHVRLFLCNLALSLFEKQKNHTQTVVGLAWSSALEGLNILTSHFSHVLHYGQDSLSVMTAFAAYSLLKICGFYGNDQDFKGARNEAYNRVLAVADAYDAAAQQSPSSSTATNHARFLRDMLLGAQHHIKYLPRTRPRADTTDDTNSSAHSQTGPYTPIIPHNQAQKFAPYAAPPQMNGHSAEIPHQVPNQQVPISPQESHPNSAPARQTQFVQPPPPPGPPAYPSAPAHQQVHPHHHPHHVRAPSASYQQTQPLPEHQQQPQQVLQLPQQQQQGQHGPANIDTRYVYQHHSHGPQSAGGYPAMNGHHYPSSIPYAPVEASETALAYSEIMASELGGAGGGQYVANWFQPGNNIWGGI